MQREKWPPRRTLGGLARRWSRHLAHRREFRMASTTRAHVYCRVSSQGQEDGYSLDTQERACRDYAAQRGLTIASVAREVWSGGDRHRPELDAALSWLERG